MRQAVRKKVAHRRASAATLKRLESFGRRPAKREPTKVTKGSGNVFADLSIPNPEEHLLKAELVRRIAATSPKPGRDSA